ncbi:SDR family NAD(P)-dependent oxidoreductase [Fulvimarina endophytica]|uniref:SDR family NAD(P)-dependent oxidoreductase n=2 Tax=Fulvimarina endophytica TaxID=2293836 RepID=A0A371XBD2_9HYPH|nr:SDR family NAD(P)-dependent oxidoreductase [Fulvimarina endophytica]
MFAGRTALVTGAASGIGRAIAVSLAERGAALALADIDEAGLAATRGLLRPGTHATLHPIDLADKDAIAALPGAVMAEHRSVDLLFNVAGVAIGGSFEQVDANDFDWLMEINFFGTVRMVRAFLPVLRQASEAQVVNISSIYGIISPPGQAAYSASKFAVRGFSNALRHELRRTSIGVSVVHPGGVATEIANSARLPTGVDEEETARQLARMNRMLKMPASKAAEIIVEGVAKRRSRILVGTDAKVAAVLERLMPVSYMKTLDWLMRRAS